jgi:RND family efflux transporter MFP subunit
MKLLSLKVILSVSIAAAGFYCAGCAENRGNTSLKDVPVNVEVQTVNYSDGSNAISYSGTIEESETTPLSFSAVGTVSRVLINEGQNVRKGQLLAELNNETYKNSYEMALATEKRAQDAYNRLLPMYKNGNVPEIKFIEVETGLQQAKSSSAIAKKGLNDCRLYSPVDGLVGKRNIDPGMTAMPNLSSITIVKIEKVYAAVSVSENEISKIKKGDKAAIKIAALNNAEFSGTVEEIGVVADPIAHTYKIKIAVANKDRSIKPGMICSLYLHNNMASKESSKLTVPNESIQVDENGGTFVYVVAADKRTVARKEVKTGALLNNAVEIVSGLNEGSLVVSSGKQKLTDGSLIRIVNQ